MLLSSWCVIRTALLFSCLWKVVWSQTDAFNPFMTPGKGEEPTAGEDFLISWEPTPSFGDRVTLRLLSGETDMTMELGLTLASKISSKVGKFKWSIPENLVREKTYGLRLSLDSDPSIFQYSYPFKIKFLKPLSTTSKKTVETKTPSPTISATLSPLPKETSDSNNLSNSAATQQTDGSDTNKLAAASATDNQTSAASPTATLVDSLSSSTSLPSPGRNGLSNGARVGIGAGIAVGVATFVSLLLWFFLWRKRAGTGSKQRLMDDMEGESMVRSPKDGMIKLSKGPMMVSEEEKRSREQAVEMDGGLVPARFELEGHAMESTQLKREDTKKKDFYGVG